MLTEVATPAEMSLRTPRERFGGTVRPGRPPLPRHGGRTPNAYTIRAPRAIAWYRVVSRDIEVQGSGAAGNEDWATRLCLSSSGGWEVTQQRGHG